MQKTREELLLERCDLDGLFASLIRQLGNCERCNEFLFKRLDLIENRILWIDFLTK
jgi:hypothetical protein